YPQEIDEVLMGHPKILEACAIGVSDTYRGETVKAYVVLMPGENLTEEDVVAYCKKNLAAYKAPRSIVFIDELPKSAVGKILRREIKRVDGEQST
ncbi:MAG: long-chain fatty acid--CoA ligase, partial [Deltaproteobacteria bacterium]|nr:long-chain fatty acid--CoA ligase [Deltaproteobacteria bacterium]